MRVFDVKITLQVVDMKDHLAADTVAAAVNQHVTRAMGYMVGENDGSAAAAPTVEVLSVPMQVAAPAP